MKLALIVSYLLAIGSVSTAVAAEKYYKWVDKNGVTHYSANRPADISTTLVRVRSASSAEQSTTANTSSDISTTENTADDSQIPLVEVDSKPTEQQLAVQYSNCNKANSKLIALENAGRVRQLDQHSGEYRYLPEQEKLTEISKMREYLKSNCRGR
jgi:hypothetical protein